MLTNSKVFLSGLLNMREKQILTSVIEIKKKIGGNHAFFEDNLSTIFGKSFNIQSNVWRSFPFIEAQLSLKNAWLPPIFFLDTKSIC